MTAYQVRQEVKKIPDHVRLALANAGTKIRDAFERFDANRDGVISPAEFRNG